MNSNVHVRFGGAGWGNGPLERVAPRPGPTLQQGRALRTETTVNDTRDFDIGKRLENLPALRQVGFGANRRLLDVQRTSCEPWTGDEAFAAMVAPVIVDGRRLAAGLRFDDPRVQALLSTLLVFRLLPTGFANRDLRELLAPLLGLDPGTLTPGSMTYNLRRLRQHGLIDRIPGTHRYRVTDLGLRLALLCTRTYRLLRPALSDALGPSPPAPTKLRHAVDALHRAFDDLAQRSRLAA